MSDKKPDWSITSIELKPLLGSVVLVDVREQEEYDESHIEGCKLIPLGEIQARASELNPGDFIVLYCAHGIRSLQALMVLKMLGFKNLRSLEGGIADWEEFINRTH